MPERFSRNEQFWHPFRMRLQSLFHPGFCAALQPPATVCDHFVINSLFCLRRQHTTGADAFVVPADQVGILLRDGIAVDRHQRVWRFPTSDLFLKLLSQFSERFEDLHPHQSPFRLF